MNRAEALLEIPNFLGRITEYVMEQPKEFQVHYLLMLINPNGAYCATTLGSAGVPLTHQGLVFLTINICLDINETERSMGTLGVKPKDLRLYLDLVPILKAIQNVG